MQYVTTEEMTFKRPYSAFPEAESSFTAPKGTPVVYEKGTYWLSEKADIFKNDAILREDVITHGFKVNENKVRRVVYNHEQEAGR